MLDDESPKDSCTHEIFSAEVSERPKRPKQTIFQVVTVMRNINQGEQVLFLEGGMCFQLVSHV